MSYLKPAEAAQKPCPVARVQGDADKDGNINPRCRAGACIAWRWRPMDAGDPRFRSALQREIVLLQSAAPADKPLSDHAAHKAATAAIARDAGRYIVRADDDLGYCGLAGRPDV